MVVSTVIYVDVLIFLNAVVDYFLLLASAKLAGRKISEKRLIFSSIFSSFTSLYIFAPEQHFLLDIAIRFVLCILICIVAFGFKNKVMFFKSLASIIAVTLLYNGIAVAFWLAIKPSAMVIKNSVVYFNISAVQMLVFSILGYLIIRIIQFLIKRFSPYANRVNLRIFNKNAVIDVTAMVDSGNSLVDVYNGKKVVITDYATASRIFENLSEKAPLYLPYKYVGGNGLISAYYCDGINVNGKTVKKVMIAVSEDEFNGDYKAIVSPDILEG